MEIQWANSAIYNQTNDDGYDEVLFNEVIGHRKNDEALPAEASTVDAVPRRTTKGWDICIKWKDESSSWHPLCEIKNSFPIHLAKYALKYELQDEPAFKWWVKEALKRHKYMLKAAKTHMPDVLTSLASGYLIVSKKPL